MRNRTALTTAVTSGVAPEPEPCPTPGDDVFGKVARPGGDGTSARVQDVELFDGTPNLPPVSGAGGSHARHRSGKPRHLRKARRARRPDPEPERERRSGMSLPLLITGALAAGFGLSVGLTSGMDQEPADKLTLTMPDLPPPHETRDTEPPSPTRTSTTAPPPSATATAAPGFGAATPRATGTGTAGPTGSGRPSGSGAPTAPERTSAPPTRSATQRPDPTPTRTAPPSERPDTQVLRRGSTGPEVEDLQRRLRRLHLYFGSTDGTFGPFLEAALSRFQWINDIPEERGVYGPLTRAALEAATRRGDRPGHDRGDDRDEWWNRPGGIG
ncbi:peptidoglycan-binding protein [Streptomyces zaomyceticus]|uniref:peptidoglycan-binding domain-containing protein n=1 Tax=Streptomyces zaomyceticus TaxID=68286 RepID=UPI0037217B89